MALDLNRQDINDLSEAIARAIRAEGGRIGTGTARSGGFTDDDFEEDEKEAGGKGQKVFDTLDKISLKLSQIEMGFREMVRAMDNIVEPWAKADKAASEYARHIGMAAAGMEALRKNTINNVVKSHIGIEFDMSSEELIKAQEDYVKGVGRNINLSNEAQTNLAAMYKVYGADTTNAMAVGMEKFGIGVNEVGSKMGKMFASASKEGISLDKFSKNVTENLRIAQNYTFKNGLKGLESMAKKATAIKLDMQQIENFSNNVNTVEGALQTSSKLQVLGGSFAQLGSDSLGMLNESLTDMEGLSNRVIDMFKGMAQYNKATGEVEVSAFNKARIREASKAMGMDYNSIMETVMTQGKQNEIRNQIAASPNASKFDKEFQDLIANTATINEKGQAEVTINGEAITLDKLNNNNYKDLVKQTQSESDDIKDIAKMLRDYFSLKSGTGKQYEANKASMTNGIGNGAKKLMGGGRLFGGIGEMNGLMKVVAAGSIFKDVLFAIGGLRLMFSNPFKNPNGRGGIRNIISRSRVGGQVGRKATAKAAEEGAEKAAERATIQAAERGAATAAERGAINSLGRSAAEVAAKKGGASVMRRGVGRAGTRAAIKAFGKTGAKLATGVVKGGGIGIVGTIGDIATDALADKGKIQKGGTAHAAMKIGSKAAEWAGLGAMLGPWGALAGAAVGATIGAVQISKIRKRQSIDAQLADKGLSLKGKYSNGRLKEIEEAMNGGKLSAKTRRELARKGDNDVLNMIKKEQEKKTKVKDNKKKIGMANISIGMANISARNFGRVGMSGIGINPLSVAQGLTDAVVKIKRKKETGAGGEVLPSPFKKMQAMNNANNGNDSSISPIKIEISGDLRLNANGMSKNIMDDLMKDRTFMQSIADIITKELNKKAHGGVFVNDKGYGAR